MPLNIEMYYGITFSLIQLKFTSVTMYGNLCIY